MSEASARVELERVVDRLRSMPLGRLAAPRPPYASRAEGARALAQKLADMGARIGGWVPHLVPDAGDAAVGDQVALTGFDLLDLDPEADVLEAMAADLREVRLTL
ncbi:MAG: hypothetical protein FJW80_02940 [Actinobacteria bacterium]|nr:hypothetical protein [Actinomycetota bacterium]